MMNPGELTRFALTDLQSAVCLCMAKKSPGKSFCYACYMKLPPLTRRELYNRVRQGYEQAYVKALVFLASARRIQRPEWLTDAQNLASRND